MDVTVWVEEQHAVVFEDCLFCLSATSEVLRFSHVRLDLSVFDCLVSLGTRHDHNTIMAAAQNASDPEVFLKIVTLGDSGVGKSSLIFRYIDGAFHTGYVSTIGVDFKIKRVTIGEQTVKLQIWDTAGQERFRTISKPYLRGAHGCVAVFDVSDPKTLESLRGWLHEFREENSSAAPKALIIVGNKTDLPPPHVPEESIKALVKELDCEYLEASAKTGAEVSTVFETIAQRIMAHRPPTKTSEPIKPKAPQRRLLCC